MSIYSICTGVTIYPKNSISGLGILFTLDGHFKDPLQADLHPLDSWVLLSTPAQSSLGEDRGDAVGECLGCSTD